MTDHDAIEYLKELKDFNKQDFLVTPKNKTCGFNPIYDCALDHAIRALRERTSRKE